MMRFEPPRLPRPDPYWRLLALIYALSIGAAACAHFVLG